MAYSKNEENRIREVYQRRTDKSRYSRFCPGHLFMVQEQERQILNLIRKEGIVSLEEKNILEVGCGTGYWLRAFVNWGAQPQNVTGIDLLPDKISVARRLCPPAMKIVCGNAANLEFPDTSFELVFQSTVFSSVLELSMREKIAAEMLRVVKKHGLLLWYDFHMNNPNNQDVCGIKKQEIIRLFPECEVNLWRITLVPFLSRVLAPYSWLSCYLLEQLNIFNTHYLGVIRKL